MSNAQSVTTADEERLARFLRQEAGDGETYIKSKFIAEEVDLTPSQVGLLLKRLREADGRLEVEKWSYTNATTWRVQAGD